MFVSCFYFFYSYFVYLHFFYFYVFFIFLFQKDSSFFNMFYNEKKFLKNCIFVWLDASPPVLPKDFFNRNGTSRGPHSGCPGRPALFVIQLHRERAVTGRIFQALPNFCPHRQTTCLLLYIRCVIWGRDDIS
jgi:hypothetical protein